MNAQVFFMRISPKSVKTSKETSCYWDEWIRLFLILRPLFPIFDEKQYGYNIQKSKSIEKNIDGFILSKPNSRQKIRILNSLKVSENVERSILWDFFNIHFVAKDRQN